MKKLIPIKRCDNTPSEYEPTLVPHGYRHRSLRSAQTEGYAQRPDLDGLVHRCGGMPVIELADGQLFAVQA